MPRNRNQYTLDLLDLLQDPVPQPTPFPIRLIQDPLPIPGPPPARPNKPRSDHFYPAWDKFIAVQPTRSKVATKPGKKLQQEKEFVEKKQPEGLSIRENASKSWEEAAAECREKVAAIVAECQRLNQKYKDALFDLECNAFCLHNLAGNPPRAVVDNGGPPWIKRVEDIFEDPVFYSDKTTGNDIHQGQVGDCWFIAALVAVSAKKELIDKLCVARDEKAGVYGFVFYRDGEWIYEVIDDKLFICVGDDNELSIVLSDGPGDLGVSLRHDKDKLKEQMQRGSEALYFSRCKSNETWLPLIEKAYAKAHGDYTTIEGGYPSEGIEDLTGGVATSISPEDIMDKQRFWDEQMSQVNKKYLFGGAGKQKSDKGIVSNHAYTVLEAWSEGDLKLLKIRNPWGQYEAEGVDWSDGSKQWTPDMMRKLNHSFGDDGIFWMSYKDFFKHFPNVNRVRLFDGSWQVAQLWTCVNVPWTVDYLDTRFELTVIEKGPLVVVLQQPDERYFSGLQGRYRYSLHFRLYREKESGHKYLMRSMHNSGSDWTCQRSVSAELEDIEPGKYYVIFKVTAFRTDDDTAREAIIKYAEERKDKLLQTGRRFDYAHIKGNLRAMEKEVRKQQRDEQFERDVRLSKEDRKYAKLDRERTRQRKKRVQEATTEKRKIAFEKAVAKRKAKKAKQKQSKEDKESLARLSTTTESSTLTSSAHITGEQESDKTVSKDVKSDAMSEGHASAEVQPSKMNEDRGSGGKSKSGKRNKIVATIDADRTTEALLTHESTTEKLLDKESEGEEKPVSATDVPIPSAQENNASLHQQADGSLTNRDNVPSATASVVFVAEESGIATVATKIKDEAKAKSLEGLLAGKVHVIDNDSSRAEDEEAWETPAEEIGELEDNDFSWDSEIDGPFNPDGSSISSDAGKGIDIFKNDPWNALCVLGLRVHSKCVVKLQVRTTDDENEQMEEEV